MATTGRQFDSDVDLSLFELLKREPFKVGFFQAVRLLRRVLPDRKPVGHFAHPSTEIVRFAANPSLSFPASEIQSLEQQPEKPLKMTVNFMGLCSPVGVLPDPYTELIIERAKKRDYALRDFLDIFNHRIISLFYRAWEKYRFLVRYERARERRQLPERRMVLNGYSPERRLGQRRSRSERRQADQLTSLLLGFIGLRTRGLGRRQQVKDETLAFYSGLLSQHPRSAQGLQQLLHDHFQVPVIIEQFVGKWIKVSDSNLARFDDTETPSMQLGIGTVIGDEVWDQQSTVRVKLGPLTRRQYQDFLPQGKGYVALKALLKFYSNEVDFEVQLVLKREEAPSLQLTGDGENNLALGWMTWIKNAPLQRDPAETVLQM